MTERNRILIADDEEDLRLPKSMIIESEFPNFEVEWFSDGDSLEKRLLENPGNVGLVLTDNTMPGIHGGEIISKYAKKPEYSGIKFILCYGGEDKIGIKAVQDGAFAWLPKPYSMQEYSEIAKKALEAK